MRCPFCAEEIQDAAILCRFCGASRADGTWKPASMHVPPALPPKPPAGSGTLRLAGVFFLVSAALEVYSMKEGVPLAGAIRSGFVATAYHSLFTAVYVAMGIALMMLRPWGYPVFLGGTALYAIDRVAFLLDTAALKAMVAQATSEIGDLASGLEGLGGLPGTDDAVQYMRMGSAAFLACWLGFAVYVIAKRSLFRPPPSI